MGADNDTLLDSMTGLLEAHIAAAAGTLLQQTVELQRRATHTGADAREKRRVAVHEVRVAVGRRGFIVPNKLFKLDFAQRMRALLSDGELVAEVLDFGASQVFAEVTNYTCILVLDRAGLSELSYRRIRGSRDEVLAELVAPESIRAQRVVTRTLGANPWVLVPPEEAAVLEVASTGSERLDAVTRQIFQGLITSADDVYVLEDRGERGGRRVVFSRASGSELELEPDLLHPLASGGDVDRYAFRSLSNLLLFPYARGGAGMRLLRLDELGRLARTFEYLAKHEARLRGRERGAMDHDGWYAFGRTQSLGNHHRHKLGVPRLRSASSCVRRRGLRLPGQRRRERDPAR